MRKLLVSLAAAGTVMAFASPAAAQWHRPAYGYNNSPRAQYQRDVQNLRMQMDELGRRGRLTGAEARDLDNDIRGTEQMIYRASRNGIQPWQGQEIERRINHVRYELRVYSDNDRGRRWGRRY